MKRKDKYFNVFYTPTPVEHEIIIKAKSAKEAVKKVKDFLSTSVQSVKEGWEIIP